MAGQINNQGSIKKPEDDCVIFFDNSSKKPRQH